MTMVVGIHVMKKQANAKKFFPHITPVIHDTGKEIIHTKNIQITQHLAATEHMSIKQIETWEIGGK